MYTKTNFETKRNSKTKLNSKWYTGIIISALISTIIPHYNKMVRLFIMVLITLIEYKNNVVGTI